MPVSRQHRLKHFIERKCRSPVCWTEGIFRFGKRGKWNSLNLRYIGTPFKILKRIGLVAYKLELPEKLSSIHNTFHVSNLKKCLSDESLIIPMKELQLDDKLNFVEEPVEVMDNEIKQLKRSRIPIIKVRWNSQRGPEFTWEREDKIRAKYLYLFSIITSSSIKSRDEISEPEEEFEEVPKEDPEEEFEADAEEDAPPAVTPPIGSSITSPPLLESPSDSKVAVPIDANKTLDVPPPSSTLRLEVPILIMPPKMMKRKAVKKIVKKRIMEAVEEYENTRVNPVNAGGYGPVITGGMMNVQEQVFEICKCTEEDKVMFAASTFEGRALTWWNGNVHTLGLVNANRIPWTEFKSMMTTEYCLTTEIQRMEQELWTLTLKRDDIEAYNNHFHELALMYPNLVLNEKKKVKRCKSHHHQGPCPLKCGRFNKLGHQEKDCRVRIPATGGNALQDVTCFGCGEKGYYKDKCPRGRNPQNEGAHGRAYLMRIEEPQQDLNVIVGTS
ncbi:putative reverse transcriptase domain-containing protein [Tanacetum coccineum]